MLKLVIGLPFSRNVHPNWALALATLEFPMSCNYAHVTVENAPRGEARTKLVEAAIGLGAEYILFLDDDTAPPSDTVVKLISFLDQHPEVAVCGGIYTVRGKSVNEPMVFMEPGGGPFWRWRAGEVFKCWGIGTGCMMIRLSIFENLPKPWFWDINDREEAKQEDGLLQSTGTAGIDPVGFKMTDDIYFCTKLAKHGLQIYAHGGILPVHFDEAGTAYVLDPDSYQFQKGFKPWYWNIAKQKNWAYACEDHTSDLPAGWLTQKEADYLAEKARGKTVLELGAYKGRSTVAMARTAKKVVSVDTFIGDPTLGELDTFPEYLRNIADYKNVIPIQANIREIEDFVKGPFDMVFVDASHSLDDAYQDFEFAKKVGYEIYAHDWGPAFEVIPAAEKAQLVPEEVVDSVANLAYIGE